MHVTALFLSLLAALFFPGIIAITKAKLTGRKAPSVFQPWFDIKRLLRKSSVYSTSTSVIFQIAPIIYLASIFLVFFLLPFGTEKGIFSFGMDFIFIAYILALGKFFMITSAMDTGSAFEGMGANREAFYSMLIEPIFFAIMGTLALQTDAPSLYNFYNNIETISTSPYLFFLIIGFIIFLLVNIALTENSRLPVDDPKTHLELTMVHEVMVLDNSGFDLGIIQIANALKFSFFGALIANFFLSAHLSFLTNVGIFLGVQGVFAIMIGVSESFRARNKLAKNPIFLLTLLSLSVLLFFMILTIKSKLILT